MLDINQIYLGDNREVMKKIDDNSIDSIVTDPPYGYKLMQSKWDYEVPSVDLWKECLRVLKPGGTLLCFAGARTSHRMAVNIEDAGFVLKDTIMWMYGTNFPKAQDLSKLLDKKLGKEREIIGVSNNTYDGCIRNKDSHVSPKDSSNIGEWGLSKTPHGLPITAPSSDIAKQFDGYKTHALKVSYEPIIMAMKPNDGTYAENAIKHNLAGLNIGECKTPIESNDPNVRKNDMTRGTICECFMGSLTKLGKEGHHGPRDGRYPSNVILDDESAKVLDEQTGILKSGVSRYFKRINFEENEIEEYERFFYCSKVSKKERTCNNTLENKHPTLKPLVLMNYLVKLSSAPNKENSIVLDPFAGSGSTLIACLLEGRPFIGIEQEREYAEIAINRLNYYIEKQNEEEKQQPSKKS